MKLLRLILPCLLLAAAGSTVQTKAPPEPAKEPKAPPLERDAPPGPPLRIAREGRSDRLDPHGTAYFGDAEVITQMYEGLVRPSKSFPLTWEPSLALRWEVAEDLLTWTFHLRSGVKFHDGATLDAEAVKRSLERATGRDKSAAPSFVAYGAYFDSVSSIDAPDANTVVLRLSEPDARILATLGVFSFSIISPNAIDTMASIEDPRERSKWLTRNPAGTGPFTIAQPADYVSEERILLTRCDDYWGGRPPTQRVEIRTHDGGSGLDALAKGEADFIPYLDPAMREAALEMETVHVHEQPGGNLAYLAMNCSAKADRPTAKLDVRKAIALAIRREQIVEPHGGAATAQHTLLPASFSAHPAGFKPAGDELEAAAALAQARVLLDAGGAPERALTMLVPNISRPYIPLPDVTANIIQQQLRAVGIEVTIEKIPLAELAPRAQHEDYDLILIGWIASMNEPDVYWQPLFGGGEGVPSGNNLSRFYSEEAAKLIHDARQEHDPEERARMYAALERLVIDENRPIVPLMSNAHAAAWHKGWSGIAIDAAGIWRLESARR